MVDKEINEVLTDFGLKTKEQETYLALLSVGETTLTPLARKANLKPTTVQSVISRLTDLGLVKVTKRKSRHVYEAHDPVVLRRILERQTKNIATIIPMLREMRTESAAGSEIKVYYRERMADIFHEALASKSKLVYEIVSAKDLQEILGEKFHFTRRRVKNKVHLKSLRVEDREIKKYSKNTHIRELREAKFLPREMTFKASIMLWDDTVAFFTTRREGLAWTVESKVMAETVLQLFETLWSVSRRMETAHDH